VVLRNGFTIKEMILIAVAWLPKATVQVWKYTIYKYHNYISRCTRSVLCMCLLNSALL